MAGLQYTIFKGSGGGDEVEAYAIGNAKTAQENDKVILNYSADMLPFRLQLTDETFKDATSNPAYAYNFLYIDKRRLCMGTSITTTYPLPVLLTRQSDGTYAYEKTLDTSSNFLSRQADFIPYGLFVRANTVYKMTAKNTIVSISSSNYIPGTLTYLNDGSLACSGGGNPKLLKNVKGEWEVVASLSGFQTDAYRGYGLIEDKLLVIESSSSSLETYTYDETGATTLVGSTTIESNVGGTYWRFFDNNTKVIVGTGYNSSDVQRSNLKVFDVTVLESGAYQFTQNSVLTEDLASIVQLKVGNLLNVIKMDDNTFFVWGEGGLVYIELLQNMIVEHPTPFKSYTWTKAFFANSIDRVAAMQISPTESIVWFIDAPVTQNWVSDTATDSLFFADKSLTGLVKENNNGILTVSTVLDPNAVVPAYPDKYGLNVTVHPGHAAQSGVTWEQPVLLSNGNMYDSNFAVEATDELGDWPAYAPFSNGAIEAWLSNRQNPSTSNPIYYEIWSTNPIKIQTIVMKNRSSYATEMLGDFVLQGTNEWYNSDSWVDLATFQNRNTTESANVTFDVNATEFYTSYRFVITSAADGSTSKRVSIGQLTITAQANLVLDEGTIDVSWGWAKSGDEYIKYDGHVPSVYGLSSGQVEGERATTMGLYLTKFESGAVFPLLSITPPSPDMSETEPYESEHLGINKFTMSLSQWGADFPYFNNVYIQSIILKPTDVSQVGEIYLKVFKKDNYDTCVACSEVGTVEGNDLKFTFLDKIPIQPSDIFRFAISTDNSINWTGVTPINMNVVRVTSNNYDFWGSWATTPLSNNDATPAIPQFSIELYQTRISYYLQDVYLSNDLTYIVAEPEPVTPSFEPDDDSTANAGSIKGTFSASVSYVGERPGKTAGTTWYYYKMPFEDIPTHPYIFQFMGALPKDDNYRWVKYSAYQYNPDAASSDTTNKIGNYELVGNTGSLPTTTSIIGVNQGNTNMLSYKTTNYPTIEGVMLITSTKLPDSVNLVWYVKEITEITNSAELSQSNQSGELYGSWYIKEYNESGQVIGTKTVYILHQPL